MPSASVIVWASRVGPSLNAELILPRSPVPAIGTHRSRGRLSSAAPPFALAAQDHDRVAAPVDDVVGGADGAGVGIVRVDALAGVGADEQVVLGRRVVRRRLEDVDHVRRRARRRPSGPWPPRRRRGCRRRRRARRARAPARRVGGAIGFRAWPARLPTVTSRSQAPRPRAVTAAAVRPGAGGRRRRPPRRWVTAHVSMTTRRPSGSTSVAVPSRKPRRELDAHLPPERAERRPVALVRCRAAARRRRRAARRARRRA